MHRIGYTHLAGGTRTEPEWVATHSQSMNNAATELLDYLLGRATPVAIIVERDSNWNGAEAELRADLSRVKDLVATHQGQAANGVPTSRAQLDAEPVLAGMRGQ